MNNKKIPAVPLSVFIVVLLHSCATSTLVTPIGNVTFEPSLSPVIGVDAAGSGVALGVGKSLVMTGDSMYLNTDQNLKNLDAAAENFLPTPPDPNDDLENSNAALSYRSKSSWSKSFLIQNAEESPTDEYIPIPSNSLQKQKELTLLAMCVYGESRSEPYEGKLSIAHVVMNRVKEQSWYGKTVKEVLLKPYQFSCFDRRDPNYKKLFHPTPDAWKQCFKAAWNAYSELSEDPTLGANHYCRHDIEPPWKQAMELKKRIGNHEFFKVSPQAMREWWFANVPGRVPPPLFLANDFLNAEYIKFQYLIDEYQNGQEEKRMALPIKYGM